MIGAAIRHISPMSPIEPVAPQDVRRAQSSRLAKADPIRTTTHVEPIPTVCHPSKLEFYNETAEDDPIVASVTAR